MSEGNNKDAEPSASDPNNLETHPTTHPDNTAIENKMIASQTTNQSTATQPNKLPQGISKALVSSQASGDGCGDAEKHNDSTRDNSSQANNTNESKLDNDDKKNESSTLSTAFTISFEEDAPNNSKKLFGIRDSIRKFAPPKPHTIEKPRPTKSEGQENSFMSIESAPGGGCSSRQTFQRDSNNSCRSSGRKSNSSRHSNISESAAFLIDKMLNCKQGESLSSICLNSNEVIQKVNRKVRPKGGPPVRKLAHSSGDILDDEVDFCEEKSDNGTYIVGADPESDAARKKMDELFGVVKAAEESLKASSRSKEPGKSLATVSRPSRHSDKKPLSHDRQEYINRLATGRHSSRSSSSSRHELTSSNHRARSVQRESRNSSCDRASKLPSSRHRRAASQSSRQSSNKDISDGETQSSRSSVHHHELDVSQEVPQPNNPSMKFNRAFALRRARLGLGEPMTTNTKLASNPIVVNGQEPESPNISPRRTVGVGQRYGSSNVQQGLSRTDGGRFSLRMKGAPVVSRLVRCLNEPVRTSQQGAPVLESYLSRISGLTNQKVTRLAQSSLSSNQNSVHSTSAMPYQSSDELELGSPSRFRTSKVVKSAGSSKREQQAEFNENEPEYIHERYNYSLGLDHENHNKISEGMGASSASQLGALDCLVISAISSLSVKIRGSVCDLMVDHAKRLPSENETRLIVEEIVPQLTANSSRPKSPTSIEEIDQSLYFDLAQTLKNLKKVEQMVDVMKLISNQMTDSPRMSHPRSPVNSHRGQANKRATTTTDIYETNSNSQSNSLSPT